MTSRRTSRRLSRWVLVALAAPLAVTAVSCAVHREQGLSMGEIQEPAIDAEAPADLPGLHNVVTYAPGYYSGSVPYEKEGGFETLEAMGVKTIISVDGAPPDMEAARAHGIAYIHLPIGYNGFDESRRLELARASRDALENGPVYVHCHHGKHRSAGAAAASAVSLGWATPEEMVSRMKVSGTSPHYKGLYACASNARVVPAAMLDAVHGDFPAVSLPTGIVKGMVEIDHAFGHLKDIESASWTAPEHHPDLVPAAEAGKLADVLRLLLDDAETLEHSAEFRTMMAENHASAQTLEDMIVANADPEAISGQFKLVSASCKDCHAKYRD